MNPKIQEKEEKYRVKPGAQLFQRTTIIKLRKLKVFKKLNERDGQEI